MIRTYSIKNGKFTSKDSIVLGKPWPNRIGIAGLAVDDRKQQQLYTVTREDKKLYVIDLKSKAIKSSFDLGAEGYACMLTPDAETALYQCVGCRKDSGLGCVFK